MSVESFGRLGAQALTLLGDLADQEMHVGGPYLSRDALFRGLSGSLALPCARATSPGTRCRLGPTKGPLSVGRVLRDASRWPDPDARSCLALDVCG
jgi:hypothetical protein